MGALLTKVAKAHFNQKGEVNRYRLSNEGGAVFEEYYDKVETRMEQLMQEDSEEDEKLGGFISKSQVG